MRKASIPLLAVLILNGACADESRALRAQESAAGSNVLRNGGRPFDPGVSASDSGRQISEYIVEMYQDRAGNIWFGTISDGVCRYDGKSFVYFTAREGFSGSSVRGMVEDNSGNLWFATDRGVSRYDGTSFTTFTVQDGLSHGKVLSVARDRNGTMWFGSDGGITRYDGTSFESVALPMAHTVEDFVFSILEDRRGIIWFGT